MPTKSSHSSSQKMPPKLRLKLANECRDLLSRVQLKIRCNNYRFMLSESKDLSDITYKKMMTLFEVLMRKMYENSSWGWNESEKLAEWKHPRTRIITVIRRDSCDSASAQVVYGEPGENEDIIAFLCFRFEVGSDKSECALYVYELHVHQDYQRQSLGSELLGMARLLGLEFKMDKILLTVFNSNTQALKFYSKHKYGRDVSSPAKNDTDYIILSTRLKY